MTAISHTWCWLTRASGYDLGTHRRLYISVKFQRFFLNLASFNKCISYIKKLLKIFLPLFSPFDVIPFFGFGVLGAFP